MYTIAGGKTGYIDSAGHCLSAVARDAQGHEFLVVILGAQTHDARSQEAKSLLDWGFENFVWE